MKRNYTAALAVFALLFAIWASSEETPSAATLFSEAMDYASSLEAISLETKLDLHIPDGGGTSVAKAECRIAKRGDTYFAADIKLGQAEVQLRKNEEAGYVYIPAREQYIRFEADTTAAELFQTILSPPLLESLVWLTQFAGGELRLPDEAEAWTYGGKEDLEATAVDKVGLKEEAYDVTAWFEEGAEPRLKKVQLDMSEQASQGAGRELKVLTDLLVTEWSAGDAVSADRFAFTPPANAKRLPSPAEAAAARPDDPMLGEVAPDLNLDLLDGGKMSLSSHKGKNTVLLDFWATWCGPCRMAMPIVERVAEAYADKGVVVYAVNQGETPEKIRAFLEQTKHSLTVALDTKNEAGQKYAVRGIPRLVIVDKEGKVAAGYVGMTPESILRSDLDKILDGAAE